MEIYHLRQEAGEKYNTDSTESSHIARDTGDAAYDGAAIDDIAVEGIVFVGLVGCGDVAFDFEHFLCLIGVGAEDKGGVRVGRDLSTIGSITIMTRV